MTLSGPSVLLDDVNRRLLRELHADPRITMSALARRVGMSAPAVTERVQRMERAGVITGYRVEVNAAALGLPVTAFARIRPAAGQLPRIAELAAELPEVSECHRITGEDCFLVKVHAAAIEDLEASLDRFLLYGQTVGSIVVSSPVPPRPLPVSWSHDRDQVLATPDARAKYGKPSSAVLLPHRFYSEWRTTHTDFTDQQAMGNRGGMWAMST
jgi:Lrp/AsnC family transcriptional regulator, leucine-responsive regulatory protein